MIDGDIEMDPCSGIAHVQHGIVCNLCPADIIEILAAVGVLVDKAAGLPDGQQTFLLHLIGAHRQPCTAEGDSTENFGNGGRLNVDVTSSVTIADGIQLSPAFTLNILLSVSRIRGAVDVGAVMTGNICVSDGNTGVQNHVIRRHGVHIRAQRFALGIGVSIGIQLPDSADDVDIASFHNRCPCCFSGDGDTCVQRDVVGCPGIGRNTKARGVGARIAEMVGIRGIRNNVKGIITVIDIDQADRYLCIGNNSSVCTGIAKRDHTGTADIGTGYNLITGTGFGMNGDIAVVGTQLTAMIQGDGYIPIKCVASLRRLAGEEASSVRFRLCREVCRRSGVYRHTLIGVQFCFDVNVVVRVDGVLASGIIRIHQEPDAGSLSNTVSLRIVRGAELDAAIERSKFCILIDTYIGSVIALRWQAGLCHINRADREALADICLGRSTVDSGNHNISACGDGSSADASGNFLPLICVGADTGNRLGNAAGNHTYNAAFLCEGRGTGVGRSGNLRTAVSYGNSCIVHIRGYAILGIGFGGKAAHSYQA